MRLSEIPRPLVLKVLLVLLLVTGLSFMASVLLAPDGTKPPPMREHEPVDYFNPGYSFQHADTAQVVPEYTKSDQSVADIPSHVVVLLDTDDQNGGGIIEVYTTVPAPGETWDDVKNRMPLEFPYGPVETTAQMVSGFDATSYSLSTENAGRMMQARGVWLVAPVNGKDIAFDIRMTVFGTTEMSRDLALQYEKEYERILSSFIVHSGPR